MLNNEEIRLIRKTLISGSVEDLDELLEKVKEWIKEKENCYQVGKWIMLLKYIELVNLGQLEEALL